MKECKPRYVKKNIRITISKIRRGDTGEIVTERFRRDFKFSEIILAMTAKYGEGTSVLTVESAVVPMQMLESDFVQYSMEV